MEAEDYKTLLQQAEDELGATPGAYCSRKVAVRAMELLRAAGQVEIDAVIKNYNTGAANQAELHQDLQKTIDCQAEAIHCLEAEKLRRKLDQARNPPNPFPDDGLLKRIEHLEAEKLRGMRLGGEIPVSERLLARIKEQAAHGNVMNDYTRIVREALNNKFDHDRPWKQC